MPERGGITLEGVTKEFPGGVVAVRELSLEVEPGEFMVLVGPSGCGKTTALRMVAGLEPVTRGQIRIGERVVTGLPPRLRDIAMVFQNYALYAHMSVRGNMGFGLKMSGMPKAEIRRRVDEAARVLGLTELLDRKPRQLSGGQRQRVAMGRAIVREPAAFLMDEPLSNLDAKLRVEMRGEIIGVQRRIAAPTLYVTHDQTEAMTMGDRVAILRDGVLQQLGTPDEIYDHPRNLFVAAFIGSPAMNLIESRLVAADGRCAVTVGSSRLAVPEAVLDRRGGLRDRVGEQVVVGVRPEDFTQADGVSDRFGRVELTVERVESLGSELVVYLDAGARTVALAEDEAPAADAAEAAIDPHALLTARLERRSGVERGPIALAVDPERLYFFDAQTGEAIL
jgi:multiple sugar transport system ATP-binding protein